jgi:hypothetical protein
LLVAPGWKRSPTTLACRHANCTGVLVIVGTVAVFRNDVFHHLRRQLAGGTDVFYIFKD